MAVAEAEAARAAPRSEARGALGHRIAQFPIQFLLAFIALAVIVAVISVRSVGRGWQLVEETLETSSQAAIRPLSTSPLWAESSTNEPRHGSRSAARSASRPGRSRSRRQS